MEKAPKEVSQRSFPKQFATGWVSLFWVVLSSGALCPKPGIPLGSNLGFLTDQTLDSSQIWELVRPGWAGSELQEEVQQLGKVPQESLFQLGIIWLGPPGG